METAKNTQIQADGGRPDLRSSSEKSGSQVQTEGEKPIGGSDSKAVSLVRQGSVLSLLTLGSRRLPV
ncbi:MAG: hypothetical protein SNJ56_07125, partial [Termitinemataceae bacterium]